MSKAASFRTHARATMTNAVLSSTWVRATAISVGEHILTRIEDHSSTMSHVDILVIGRGARAWSAHCRELSDALGEHETVEVHGS